MLGIVKAAKIKKPDLTAVNELDLEKAMGQLKRNDAKLTNLNLNNHRDVNTEILEDVAKALKSNTNLKHLHLANTQMTDKTAKVMFVLSVERNYELTSYIRGVNEWENKQFSSQSFLFDDNAYGLHLFSKQITVTNNCYPMTDLYWELFLKIKNTNLSSASLLWFSSQEQVSVDICHFHLAVFFFSLSCLQRH